MNAENTIHKCIQSIIDQDYPHIEYIVIDGASSDATCRIIRKANRADIFQTEPDDGLYHAMNKGIARASGDYILFLNADDYLVDSTVISRVAQFILLKPADVYYGNIEVRSNRQQVSIYKPWDERFLIGALSIYCLPHQAMFSSRSIFEKISVFTTEFRVLSDYDWYLRAYQSGAKFKYMDLTIASFSFDGISSDPNIRMDEFNFIQNHSELYGSGLYDVARIESSIFRINELKAELVSLNVDIEFDTLEIGSFPPSLLLLALQRKICRLESIKYSSLSA